MINFFKKLRKENFIKYCNQIIFSSNETLFDEWCIMDMLCSNNECTLESIFRLCLIESELKKRGFGDSNGKIIPKNIKDFYKRRSEVIWEF